MKKTLILLLCLSGILFADYDQRNILLKKANYMISHRQYEKAEQIFEQLLEESPQDHAVMELYILNLIRVSKIEEADEKLRANRKNIPEMVFVKLETSILINQGEIDTAKTNVFDFLSRNSGNIYLYVLFQIPARLLRYYVLHKEALNFQASVPLPLRMGLYDLYANSSANHIVFRPGL